MVKIMPVHDKNLDLRQVIGDDLDFSNLASDLEAIKSLRESGHDVFEHDNRLLEEIVDEWILNRQHPSMSPGVYKVYKERLAVLTKEGRIQ